MRITFLRPRRAPAAPALACVAVFLLISAAGCSRKPDSQQSAAPKQETEVLFRRMQAAWNQIFTTEGSGDYRMARIELYRGEKETPCGKVSGGVHYCAERGLVTVDLDWLEGVKRSQPAAPAYLLARTLARHVQHQLTVDERVEKAIAADPRKKDELLRQREMQTECFVGLWRKNHEGQAPAPEELKSAARWWSEQGGAAPPASTLEERLKWFDRGLAAEEIAACNVFAEAR
jgi:predicted metalloprotease